MKATLEDLRRELWLRARNKSEIVWTTKDGREIPINQMTDEHLVNTINMIVREQQRQQEQQQYEDDCWEALSSIGDTIF